MKLAIFDVDGTLYNGNLGIEFAKELIAEGLLSKQVGEEIFTLYAKYKSGEMEKSLVVDMIYEIFAKGLCGCLVKDVDRVAQKNMG